MAMAFLALGFGPSVGLVEASVSATVRRVTFENASSQVIDLAIIKKWGSPCGGANWYLAGWYTLDPGERQTFETTSTAVYYHGSGVDGGTWDGNDGDEQLSLYVGSGAFEWCYSESSGWYAAYSGEPKVNGADDNFITLGMIDLSDYRSYTQRLTG